jgi:5-formyltetrahydrofolate cyclo-ligase
MNNEDKNKVRQKFWEMRSKLNEEFILSSSLVIIDTLFSLKEYAKSEFIMSYMDFKNEVKTSHFISKSLKMNKRVSVPVVCDINGIPDMIASEVLGLEDNMVEGAFGIRQPLVEKAVKVDEKLLDFILVPGLAFDVNFKRIGFGKGYYDRFLNKVRSNCLKVGICFDLQLAENIPFEAHDIAMDIIVTEKRILYNKDI